MSELVITPIGTKALLSGDVSPELEKHLRSKFMWISALNLNDEKLFYSDKIMYVGLMHDVREEIESFGYRCVIEWPVIPDRIFDWKFTGELRTHQPEAVDAIIEKRFGILEAPMRAGKTVIMAATIAKIGLPTVIVTANQIPMKQAVNTLRKLTNIDSIGVVGDDEFSIGDVTVCTIQSILARYDKSPALRRALDMADVVMIDECHKAASDSFITLLDTMIHTPRFMVGVSATPYREDDRHEYLQALLGPPLFQRTMGDMIQSGNICPMTFYVATVPPVNYGYIGEDGPLATERVHVERQYQKVVREYIVQNPVRNNIVADFVKSAREAKMTCGVVVDRVAHAEELHKIIPNSVVLHAKTKNRDKILDMLHHREVDCVITTLFQEATDVPSLDCIAIAAGGKATGRFKQRLRNLTKFEGELRTGFYKKERGYILYLKDQADFLRSHSTSMVKLIKQIVKEHKKNEIHLL